MRSAATRSRRPQPSASTIAASLLQVLQGHPFQGSDYTRRVKSVAGLLVGLARGRRSCWATDLAVRRRSRGAAGFTRCRPLELKTYDWRLTRTARPETARQDIALVEIDEYSLRNLQPNAGRWPWPRVVHAMLLDYLARAPAKVIAYDVNFAEADTRTRLRLRRRHAVGRGVGPGAGRRRSRPPATSSCSPTRPTTATSGESRRAAGHRLRRSIAPGAVERARRAFRPSPRWRGAARGSATTCSCSIPTARCGTPCRSCGRGSRVLPSLGLAAALRGRRHRARSDVRLDGNRLRIGDRVMPLSSAARQERRTAPSAISGGSSTSAGPALLADLKTPHLSDLLVLRSALLARSRSSTASTPDDRSGGLPRQDRLRRHDGVRASSTSSRRRSRNGKMPGIQVHAAVADDMLSNRFIREAGAARPRRDRDRRRRSPIGLVATALPAWWATAATAVLRRRAWRGSPRGCSPAATG